MLISTCIKVMSWPGKLISAYKYLGLALASKDSSYQTTIKSLADFQKLSFGAQIHAQELEKEEKPLSKPKYALTY